jgi:hypothetical protein
VVVGEIDEPVIGDRDLSINTVRGRAFRAVFAYIFWCDRHREAATDASRIPPEAKRLLEAHLEPGREPGLTIRSVYGEYFPWLYTYDSDWAKTLIDALFPASNKRLRYAAWETYLAKPVFNDVYEALQPQYELAISEAPQFTKDRQFWSDPTERLAHHLVVAYLFRMGDDKLWARFFRTAGGKLRGSAVSFVGRVYLHRDQQRSETHPATNRLQEFWEWRLGNSKDLEELKQFGWWVVPGKFNDSWMLNQLVTTLKRTGGIMEPAFQPILALMALAAQYPRACAEAFVLIVKSRFSDRMMLGHNPDIERALSVLYCSDDAGAVELAEVMIDHLTKLGFEQYRNILQRRRAALRNDTSNPPVGTAE